MKNVYLTKNKKLTLAGRRAIFGLVFISPWLIGFVAFYIRSIIMTVQFSLSEVSISAGTGGYQRVYVGIDNFIYEFTKHASFKQMLVTSITNIVIDVPLIIFFSLFMALVLNKKMRGRTLIRAIFFLPVIMNSEAIVSAIEYSRQMIMGGLSSMSADMTEAASGGVNVMYYLELFQDIALPDSILNYIISAVARINDIITASGVQIVIFIAALQAVSPSLYEVSKIEGATGYETFWKVTLPMVTPHIITNIVYTMVISFMNSEIVTLAYDTAFRDQMWGLSSAISLTTTVIVCGILLIVCTVIQKRTFYYN